MDSQYQINYFVQILLKMIMLLPASDYLILNMEKCVIIIDRYHYRKPINVIVNPRFPDILKIDQPRIVY